MKQKNLNDYLANLTDVAPDLSGLILTVANACLKISNTVGKGALANVLGSLETENVQGEVQKKLDVISNEILLDECEPSGYLAAIASEEMEDIYTIGSEYKKGPYLLLFDPLDGSSNIDVNVSIGTIFSVLAAPKDLSELSTKSFLQAGTKQLAAGYAIYGPQTILVLSLGQGVASFTLDKENSIWVLNDSNVTLPQQTKEFAINMSNMRHWHAPVRSYIDDCLVGATGPLGKDYNMRWIASMVADVHRILTRGGVFLYPNDARANVKDGKLRLMYEANPMSFLIEQAGGRAITGTQRILEIEPTRLHQRVSVILGSSSEIDTIEGYFNASLRA